MLSEELIRLEFWLKGKLNRLLETELLSETGEAALKEDTFGVCLILLR